MTILFGSSENNSQSITHHGGGACVTESMSVLTDPTTYGVLNSELTNCPRTAAVLGELAAHWHQMMGTLQRVEQEAVSSQSLANAIESIGRTRTEATAGRTNVKRSGKWLKMGVEDSVCCGSHVKRVMTRFDSRCVKTCSRSSRLHVRMPNREEH